MGLATVGFGLCLGHSGQSICQHELLQAWMIYSPARNLNIISLGV